MQPWYFAWIATTDYSLPGKSKGVIIQEVKWGRNDVIPISFLDGSDDLQARVREAALAWTTEAGGPASLTFDFRKGTTDTPIRISFKEHGYWSVLGTTCKNVEASRPTMNFGGLEELTSAAKVGVVLHEFGHALGLVHEHQSPASSIEWDEAAVLADLAGWPNYWSEKDIRVNVLDRYAPGAVASTAMDPDSIMMYPIPAHWTKGTFSREPNLTLSTMDVEFVAEQYP